MPWVWPTKDKERKKERKKDGKKERKKEEKEGRKEEGKADRGWIMKLRAKGQSNFAH